MINESKNARIDVRAKAFLFFQTDGAVLKYLILLKEYGTIIIQYLLHWSSFAPSKREGHVRYEQLEKSIRRNKLAYCENCKENVPYNIKELPMNGTVRDKEYHYTGKEAYCNICGASVCMREINDINLDNLYNEFRKQNRKHKQ